MFLSCIPLSPATVVLFVLIVIAHISHYPFLLPQSFLLSLQFPSASLSLPDLPYSFPQPQLHPPFKKHSQNCKKYFEFAKMFQKTQVEVWILNIFSILFFETETETVNLKSLLRTTVEVSETRGRRSTHSRFLRLAHVEIRPLIDSLKEMVYSRAYDYLFKVVH